MYAVAGVWENMTGETEEAVATAAIKKLDSNFRKEEWAEVGDCATDSPFVFLSLKCFCDDLCIKEVRTTLAPVIIKAHLQGDTKTLKPWLGEAVYNKLAADIRVQN